MEKMEEETRNRLNLERLHLRQSLHFSNITEIDILLAVQL